MDPPTESDPTVGSGDIQWSGSSVLPLSNLVTSGQVGVVRLSRNQMVLNFPIYLKSSTAHATPFTSGIVSGQIAQDGGNFTQVQSGAFLEVGLGFYTLQSLTSGDLNCHTMKLLFTAQGVSGGSSDPLPLAFILQG